MSASQPRRSIPGQDTGTPITRMIQEFTNHGCPVILCTADSRYEPGGSRSDLKHPNDWMLSEADPAVAERYVEGLHTAALVTGHGVDAIDVDYKNGADVEETAHAARQFGVKLLGQHSTPSGGAHLFIPSTGIASAAHNEAGIDFRGGCIDGSGRGLIYLPGSHRPKYPDRDYAIDIPMGWQMLERVDVSEQREATSAFLRSVGIVPRLATGNSLARGVEAQSELPHLPPALAEKISDLDSARKGQRSERFHFLVAECQRAGLSQGETAEAMAPWCEAVSKYVGRVGEEVARSWSKISEDMSQSELDASRDVISVGRRVVLSSADQIVPRPTTWLWQDRMPTSSLSLIAGPEGTGKSTCAYWLAAHVTRGTLPGVHMGTPRNVFVAATEDSWEMTITPRLIAAGADLSRIFRVEVMTSAGMGGALTLPKDVRELEVHVQERKPALLLLDPIMSRVDSSLDTHRDQETRQALEPLAGMADRFNLAVVGLIHFNKSESGNLLNNVMASKAFVAVARSVSVVVRDPQDEAGLTRIFATVKSNLGRDELPVLPFRISDHRFSEAGNLISTSRIDWLAERDDNIHDLVRESQQGVNRSIVQRASDWLAGFMDDNEGCAPRSGIVDAGKQVGLSDDQLKRAFRKLKLAYRRTTEYPATTYWMTAERAAAWDRDQPQGTVRAQSEGSL